MSSDNSPGKPFRHRFIGGELLIGTFMKTPATQPVEVIGDVGFEFVVIDEEHAPWDRVTIDAAILAARACGTAALVRVAEPTAAKILSVLDDGATGILVPHVSSAAKAKEIADACRYRKGKRGFSNTTRAGRFGATAMWEHADRSDDTVTAIAMIEDPEALDEIDAIVATEGLDGFFIGRGDLTMAYGVANASAPEVRDACDVILSAAKRVGKPVVVMVANAEEAKGFQERGASAFIVASDQGFMRKAAAAAYSELAALGTK